MKPAFIALGLTAAVAAPSLAPSPAEALAVRPGFDSNTLPANDDGSTGLVGLGFTVDFFGLPFSQAYVNNNGNITFDSPLSEYTPFDLTSTGRQIIAPFFGDVDTRAAGSAEVSYGAGTIGGRDAFVVNWGDVGYYNTRDDKLNSFQLVLIDRSDVDPGDFDVEFNYDRIEWETGDASGGTDGLGGNSARVGWSNGTGDPGTFFELPGSAVNGAFLDGGPNALIADSLNSDVDGRYLFFARNGSIEPPEIIPVPAAGLLLVTAAGALALVRRRR